MLYPPVIDPGIRLSVYNSSGSDIPADSVVVLLDTRAGSDALLVTLADADNPDHMALPVAFAPAGILAGERGEVVFWHVVTIPSAKLSGADTDNGLVFLGSTAGALTTLVDAGPAATVQLRPVGYLLDAATGLALFAPLGAKPPLARRFLKLVDDVTLENTADVTALGTAIITAAERVFDRADEVAVFRVFFYGIVTSKTGTPTLALTFTIGTSGISTVIYNSGATTVNANDKISGEFLVYVRADGKIYAKGTVHDFGGSLDSAAATRTHTAGTDVYMKVTGEWSAADPSNVFTLSALVVERVS